MQKNILLVSACVRKASRTRQLARRVLSHLEGNVRTLELDQAGLQPLNAAALAARDACIGAQDYTSARFDCARELAAAEAVVIAAPYWDLSFPALLKIYFENVCVNGLTFRYEDNRPVGLCRAQTLYYVTTAGGPILYDGGFDYTRALAQNLFGIPRIVRFAAENLDVEGADVDAILAAAAAGIDDHFRR